MSARRTATKWLLPLLLLVGGFLGMRGLVETRTPPARQAREDPGALVEVMTATAGDRPVRVFGTGTVQTTREVTVTPQVSGEVVEISPRLVPGGFLSEGDLLFRVDPADYRLALQRSRSDLAQAELELAKVESQADVARREWEDLALPGDGEPNPLVLYEPQLKQARARVDSARAAVAQARLDLERTELRAPFNARVRSEEVDVGQYVRSGTGVAVLAGTDTAEVRVPLTPGDLRWLRVPRAGSAEPGARATVALPSGGRTYEWTGRVVRSVGEVDPESRMSPVVVEVEDPYDLARARAGGPSLAPGSFVELVLHGKTLSGVVPIPRSALRQGDTVWIYADGRLEVREVEVARRERDEILLRGGVEPGDRVILTNLAGAVEGMRLRAADSQEPGAAS